MLTMRRLPVLIIVAVLGCTAEEPQPQPETEPAHISHIDLGGEQRPSSPIDDPLVERGVLLGEWTGKGTKGTETFYVPSHEWGVWWQVTESEPCVGIFNMAVYDADDGTILDIAANFTGPDTDFSVMRGSGNRYLEISGANVNWTVRAAATEIVRQSVIDAEIAKQKRIESAEREALEERAQRLEQERARKDALLAEQVAERDQQIAEEREKRAEREAREAAAAEQSAALMAAKENQRKAEAKLHLAKKYLDIRKPEAAAVLLQEIVDDFDGTPAAEEAELMLSGLE